MKNEGTRAAERRKNLGLLVEAAENLLDKVTEFQTRVWRCRDRIPTSTELAIAAGYFHEAYVWSNRVHLYLDREKGMSL